MPLIPARHQADRKRAARPGRHDPATATMGGGPGDVKVINCKEGHELIKITAKSDDELVQRGRAHLKQYHPELANMSREQILAMATNE
jgi:hypothetical protein